MDFMFLSRFAPQLLSVLRIITALLFFAHGSAKYFGFPAVEGLANVPPMSPGGIAGILEIVGGILLVIGLFSRLTAFILSGLMAVAYFMVHAPQGFHPILNNGELAILYCFIFLYIAAAGPGPWSVDASRGKA
ncbi:DoxX family protein [Nordella sp. HKS 07]|uniref:DoxX family protein n=1 Tax=Nordella sp. HKS 07 TaxID=2712222 RepID=UPI001FEF9814|nr:DoxX family protein [Nordella sp. HKS 07]